ncbi:MAG TPA: FGGY family carbohydrate kinase, partial [Dehalococcoidia bacterium]|nr:FGGY family carbohydrate kinase [Dehalococcoidia bacterium]
MSSNASRIVLTLDVGTSSVRAMLWDERGDTCAGWEAELPHQMTLTPDGGVETDPRRLLKRTTRCIDLVLERAGRRAGSIAAVGISTFWHSLMGISAAGKPLTPLYTWADTRSQAAAEQLKGRLDERAVHARTGCMLHSSYLPAKLLWLSESQSETFGQVQNWMSFGEYLSLQLLDKPVASVSMASGTGLFNQDTCEWDEEVLSVLPISVPQLSEIAADGESAGSLAGKFTKRWPALKQTPWFP